MGWEPFSDLNDLRTGVVDDASPARSGGVRTPAIDVVHRIVARSIASPAGVDAQQIRTTS